MDKTKKEILRRQAKELAGLICGCIKCERMDKCPTFEGVKLLLADTIEQINNLPWYKSELEIRDTLNFYKKDTQ